MNRSSNIEYYHNHSETSSISENSENYNNKSEPKTKTTDQNDHHSSNRTSVDSASIDKKVPKTSENGPVINRRRKSQIEKHEELLMMKIGAMNQLENTFKITDLVKERDIKISKLQSDNEKLHHQVDLLKLKLEESRNINKELMEKLHTASEKEAQRKIESENQRTCDLLDVTMPPQTSYTLYLNDILSTRDQLLDQNKHLEIDLETANMEITGLKKRIRFLESVTGSHMTDQTSINDSNIDSRSKKELLHLIRECIDDKMIWMEYGINLTKEAVTRAPDLLRRDKSIISEKEAANFCCTSEANWAAFSIEILQKVNKQHPTLVQELIKPPKPVSSDFIKSKLI